MPALDDSIQELRKQASQLHDETEALNKLILDLEDQLQDVGVSAWLDDLLDPVRLTSDELRECRRAIPHAEEAHEGWRIGYMKLGARWRIVACRSQVVTGVDDSGIKFREFLDVGDPVSLESASRLVRVQAAGLLEDLVKCLTGRVEEFITSIGKAREVLEGKSGEA